MSNEKIIPEKHYEPATFEEKIYKEWEAGMFFSSNVNEKTPFTIVMPPPNITGKLHMGHALDQTLQDLIIRHKRLLGFNALLLPGTDHASIATEVKVADILFKETKKTKEEIGRDEFLKKAWEWKNKYGGEITKQMRRLGISCDWDKERFTMDDGLSNAVLEIFIDYYKNGYIYKGERLVNYCTKCKTSLSDAEVNHIDEEGFYWYFKYPVIDENFDFDSFKSKEDAIKNVVSTKSNDAKNYEEFITIATSRPETIFGDTAICVNPKDKRYKKLIGKTAIIPYLNRKIPIIADSYADMEKGSGAVKITPAHDFNDEEVGRRNNLPFINIMDKEGCMNEYALDFCGMNKEEAREKFIKKLEELGYFVKKEKQQIPIGRCYRCDTAVEPLISNQWFLKMDDLAKEALTLINKDKDKKEELKFIPDRFKKIYTHWLTNIKDWCISRQLYWGHRIPIYYCKDCKNVIASVNKPDGCEKCGSKNLVQDESVLDTWFSSALWPFSTLGWPKKTKELEYYFPTDVLVTGYDIIFFWVIRMAFTSKYLFNKSPFKDVYIHGLVRDENNNKMSKSLGNGIDPIDVIEKYGCDALRYMLVDGTKAGSDLRFSYEKIESARNFANKLHNASRFILLNNDPDFEKMTDNEVIDNIINGDDKISRAMLYLFNSKKEEILRNLDNYDFSVALSKIYDLVRGEFCDWYIEFLKGRFNENIDLGIKNEAFNNLCFFLKECLILLHPFMPFITENIYSYLKTPQDKMLISSSYIKYNNVTSLKDDYISISYIKEVIRAIRNLRVENKVENNIKLDVLLVSLKAPNGELIKSLESEIITLAKLNSLNIVNKDEVKGDSYKAIIKDLEIYVLTSNLINKDEEIKKLLIKKEQILKEIEFRNKKLSNEDYIKKAPKSVVDIDRKFLKEKEDMLLVVEEKIKSLK